MKQIAQVRIPAFPVSILVLHFYLHIMYYYAS